MEFEAFYKNKAQNAQKRFFLQIKDLNQYQKTKRVFMSRKLKDISRQSMNFPAKTAFLPTIKDIETKQKD